MYLYVSRVVFISVLHSSSRSRVVFVFVFVFVFARSKVIVFWRVSHDTRVRAFKSLSNVPIVVTVAVGSPFVRRQRRRFGLSRRSRSRPLPRRCVSSRFLLRSLWQHVVGDANNVLARRVRHRARDASSLDSSSHTSLCEGMNFHAASARHTTT